MSKDEGAAGKAEPADVTFKAAEPGGDVFDLSIYRHQCAGQDLRVKIFMQQKITNLLADWQKAPMRDWIDNAVPVLAWMDEQLKTEQADALSATTPPL